MRTKKKEKKYKLTERTTYAWSLLQVYGQSVSSAASIVPVVKRRSWGPGRHRSFLRRQRRVPCRSAPRFSRFVDLWRESCRRAAAEPPASLIGRWLIVGGWIIVDWLVDNRWLTGRWELIDWWMVVDWSNNLSWSRLDARSSSYAMRRGNSGNSHLIVLSRRTPVIRHKVLEQENIKIRWRQKWEALKRFIAFLPVMVER